MKILKKFVFIILFLIPLKSFAASVPIEKVFNDITPNYKYYTELQTMYDKGMFFPDENGKFNSDKLLTREEFVGVMSEVTCKKCIKPDVSYDYVEKYNTFSTFFDVLNTSKYFYCIAGASDLEQVKGYDVGYSCENGMSKKGIAPFCPQNTIVLEEALAILLRASNILTNSEAEEIRKQIENGQYFPTLAGTINPRLSDGSVYSFYPDFQKALYYIVKEYDTDGNEKIYKLLDIDSGSLNPKKAISKEEFLKMAYVLLKGNSCINSESYDIALKINILDEDCSENISETCDLSNLKTETNIFDFMAEVGLENGDKITNEKGYIWRFYNFETGEETIKYGKYIDNYKFLKDGKYRVYLLVKTDNGKTGQVYNDLNILNGDIENNTEKNDLKVSIKANPISGYKGINIDFEGIISSNLGVKSYFWEFGDGEVSYGKKINHIFNDFGVYEVNLTVTDSSGIKNSGSVLIYIYDEKEDNDIDGDGVLDFEDKCIEIPGVIENEGCPIDDDIDKDGVLNNDDKCVYISGEKENSGCPIFELECETEEDCSEGNICSDGICKVKDFATNCEYSGGNLFYGNIICEDCPCDYSADFYSDIRNCDIIFPAITSPDETTIYSKGEFYKIEK